MRGMHVWMQPRLKCTLRPESINGCCCSRQCSSGLQAVADVAAAIKAGYYDIGIAAGLESMTSNPMAWKAGVNPRVAELDSAANCMLPMGAQLFFLHCEPYWRH